MKIIGSVPKAAWLLGAVLVFLLIAAPRCPQVCQENGDCNETAFCLKAPGHCVGAGLCAERPEACIMIYDPVCGCDQQTYASACFAAMAGVSVAYQGECEIFACVINEDCDLPGMPPNMYCAKAIGDCDGYGECVERPEACYEIYDPVCGCDERTYSNNCYAALAGVNIAYPGACDQACVEEGGAVPIVPGAPECCPGLVMIPCDEFDEATGECVSCEGAAYCAYCGNGECGPGENLCRCPEDCP